MIWDEYKNAGYGTVYLSIPSARGRGPLPAVNWCTTHAVADVVTADDSTGTGKWQIQGRQQTPTLSKAASKHLEEIEQLSRHDAEFSASTVVSDAGPQ